MIAVIASDKDNAADAKKFFNMAITKVGFVERPEMNEAFFEAVYPGRGITTEEEFRPLCLFLKTIPGGNMQVTLNVDPQALTSEMQGFIANLTDEDKQNIFKHNKLNFI